MAITILPGSIDVDKDHIHIKVESETESGKYHYVTVNTKTGCVLRCDCGDFVYRAKDACKHMKAVIDQRLVYGGEDVEVPSESEHAAFSGQLDIQMGVMCKVYFISGWDAKKDYWGEPIPSSSSCPLYEYCCLGWSKDIQCLDEVRKWVDASNTDFNLTAWGRWVVSENAFRGVKTGDIVEVGGYDPRFFLLGDSGWAEVEIIGGNFVLCQTNSTLRNGDCAYHDSERH